MKIDADILALNLECISHKACITEGWTLAFVDAVERQYRAFLQLIRHSGQQSELAPTLIVDRYWHHHILDTAKYACDCQSLFGTFVHHYPYSGLESEAGASRQHDRVARSVKAIDQLLA